ncbi:MAG: molecular chaperone GrpE [Thermomicrobiales bacterium]|nr:molecular chaperone GrpE [Thermomicrobiales bacterium]
MTDVAEQDQQRQPPMGNAGEEQDLLGLLQRERADFLNYRRRAAQERGDERDRARLETLNALLPLLDDLDLALTQAPPDLAEHPWTRGLLLSRRRLLDFLARVGLEPFGAPGELFDPALHEAVFYEQRPEFAVRRVETVLRPGYRMGGRVVRPAQVGVVGPVEDETPEAAAMAGGDGPLATGNDESDANDRR